MFYQFMMLTLVISSCVKIWTIQILNSKKMTTENKIILTLNDVKCLGFEKQKIRDSLGFEKQEIL
jgi:hypothetical protein